MIMWVRKRFCIASKLRQEEFDCPSRCKLSRATTRVQQHETEYILKLHFPSEEGMQDRPSVKSLLIALVSVEVGSIVIVIVDACCHKDLSGERSSPDVQ